MTKEEAIEILKCGEPTVDEIDARCKYNEAIDMAVKALKVNEVHMVIIHDIDGNPQVDRCFDNLKSAFEYADYLHSQNINWVDLQSIDLYSGIQDFGKDGVV